jgi:dihydroorotase
VEHAGHERASTPDAESMDVPEGGFDLALRGGRVVDPLQRIDGQFTLFVQDGKVAEIASPDDPRQAVSTIECDGALVVPGLVDFHTHCYWGGTALGVNADKIGPATGVTTWIDTGSAGAGNFEGFYHHVIRRAAVRIVPFIHISHIGLTAGAGLYVPVGELFDFRYASFHETVRVASAYASVIAGVKVRASVNATGPHSLDALRLARHAADVLETRLMVHVGPPPPFIEDVLEHVRPGDIVTHCYTPYHGGILDGRGRVKDVVRHARDQGVLFDVGHGSGSFSFEVAERALDQGFMPDTISSDLHAKCVDGPAFDLPTTMEKFLALGLGLEDVLARTTHIPAAAVGLDHVGTLAPGSQADVAIVRYASASVPLHDVLGKTRTGSRRLSVERTLIAGRCVEPVQDDRREAHGSSAFPSLSRRYDEVAHGS